MKQKYKINILNEIIDSITKFEKYEEYATHKLKATIVYTLKLIIIISIILSIVFTIKSVNIIQELTNEFKEKIYSIEYENGKLSVNYDGYVQILFPQFINIIIDTSISNSKSKETENLKKLSNKENNIVFLKDKCIIKNMMLNNEEEYNYQNMQNNGIEINQIFNDILTNNKIKFNLLSLVIFVTFLISLFLTYGFNFIMDVLIFALISKLTSLILRVPLKFKENYNISTHALTLSTVLQTIYILINLITGFDIKYFYLMYIGISYIYIVTAIFMIKTELIKRKQELEKIIKEQQNTKKEFEQWNEKSENNNTHEE